MYNFYPEVRVEGYVLGKFVSTNDNKYNGESCVQKVLDILIPYPL
jgi:hypothetical protein